MLVCIWYSFTYDLFDVLVFFFFLYNEFHMRFSYIIIMHTHVNVQNVRKTRNSLICVSLSSCFEQSSRAANCCLEYYSFLFLFLYELRNLFLCIYVTHVYVAYVDRFKWRNHFIHCTENSIIYLYIGFVHTFTIEFEEIEVNINKLNHHHRLNTTKKS